jgi:hypothetical protein
LASRLQAENQEELATKERSHRRRGFGGPGRSQKKQKISLLYVFSVFLGGKGLFLGRDA